MIKLPRIILVILGVLLIASTAWAAGETFQGFGVVNVIVNGKPLQSDVPAVNFYGRTVLPLRTVAEASGMTVQWEAASNTATLTSLLPVAKFAELQADNSRLLIDLATAKKDLDSAKSELKTVKQDLASAQDEIKRLTSMPAADPVFKSSGHAQAATPLFRLDPGIYVVKMTHSGYGHFSVVAYSSTGQYIELLANDSGAPFGGSKALIIKTVGKYLLDISADADWVVSISRSE